MLKESIPTASASTASSTAFRIAWSPPIGCPDPSTVTGRNVSRPNSSVDMAYSPLLVADYLSGQTNLVIRYSSGSCAKECPGPLRLFPGRSGPGAPGKEGDEEPDRRDDAAEDLERGIERDRRDGDAGEDRGHRERSVGDDEERGKHAGTMLGRDLGDECAQPAAVGGAEAGAADDRSREVARR